ncbi:peptidase M16 [Marinomonas ushuaiensis DSM 15871]|uniref:Protease 3 n=2 Tax=Marinomonas TaxID=28253 RepID=X7E239_9GAMM|nr:peptidase M16 [Marinomonas ushuaiensis DSM 15871]
MSLSGHADDTKTISTTPTADRTKLDTNNTEDNGVKNDSANNNNNNMREILNKSLTDTNNYYTITLPNKLKVLLISDPQAERFSASLSVNVGSFQDPDQQQGLAHFLEHMLFLGTEKYPESGDYQSFININGGSHNAYTSTDTTNFHFDIKPDAYEGGLDRFSQFFTTPLFSESLTQREKNAVDSEYKAKFKNESRRNNQAFKTLINSEHPYNHFTVGNLDTLKDLPNNPLREQLLTLYKQNYFAENMALVLVANLSSDRLSTLAHQYFSDIPSGTLKNEERHPTLIPIGKPRLQFVRSLIDNNTLSFYYQIDPQSDNYKTQPTRYLSYILGNENKGSLFSSLKSEGLINSISASTSPDYGDNAFFSVKMHLTNEGMEKIDIVAKQLFATITLLRSSSINPLYLDEGLKLSQLMYNNQSYVDPQTLARSLSSRMLKIPVEDILSSFRVETTANKEQVARLLQQLNTENLLVQIATNKDFPENWAEEPVIWKTEPWYQSEYSNNDFSQSFLNFVNLAVTSTYVSLPEKNNFIPESLDLIDEKDDIPSIVFQKEGFTYWNKSDSSFKKPVAMNFVTIRFDHATDTPENILLNRLWSRLFNDSVSESTYTPYVAGLGFSFYPHANGATLRTNGYSDKQGTYITWLIDQLFLFRPSIERFELAKKQLEKDLSNQKSRQAYSNANSAFSTLITKRSFTTKELEKALTSLSLEDLLAFTKQAREHFDIVGYSTGNITKEQTEKLALSLYQRFDGRLFPRTPIEIETKHLTAQQKLHYQFDSTSDDNVVLYTIISTSTQNPETTKEEAITEKAYISILKKLINSPFYQELRTDKQLGYIVGTQNLSIRDTPILGLLIQSPNKDTLTIINAMQIFLKAQENRLKTLPEEEFNTAKNALLNELKTKAKNLSDNAFNEWSQIAKGEKHQTREEWINTVENLKVSDFIRFTTDKLQAIESTNIIIHNKSFPAELIEKHWVESSPSFLLLINAEP